MNDRPHHPHRRSPRCATLFVLVKGVIGMAQGKDITGQRSQELMRKRILFQAIAILLVDPAPAASPAAES